MLLPFLQWKARNQIAYSYRLPEEEVLIHPNVNSGARRCELEDNADVPSSSQHEVVLSQRPAPKGSSALQPAPKVGPSVINQIETLLITAENLSCTIPTTGERMSRISGLFPPGHGPSAEGVEAQTQCEINMLDSFRIGISCMRTCFSDFGLNQDAVCRDYEREASVIEKQIREQEATTDQAAARDDHSFAADTA